MRLQLIQVAQKPPAWTEAACHEYLKRMPPELKPRLVTLALPARQRKQTLARRQQQETRMILQQFDAGDYNLALDQRGELWSSQDWSQQLQRWMFEHPRVNLIVGGPDGLTSACRQACQRQVSLGRLTLPHALVKIIVVEQLYRAWTICQGHPYHRV